MIRATGVLAAAASVTFAILLFRNTQSVELSGQVSDLQHLRDSVNFTNVFDPDPGALYLQSTSTIDIDPGEAFQQIVHAHYKFAQKVDFRWTTTWMAHLPDEVLRAAKSGDELTIRAKGMVLPMFARAPIPYRRYELRRGSENLYFDGPVNGKFILVWLLAVGSPLFLWGVAAGIAAWVGMFRKKTAPTPPA